MRAAAKLGPSAEVVRGASQWHWICGAGALVTPARGAARRAWVCLPDLPISMFWRRPSRRGADPSLRLTRRIFRAIFWRPRGSTGIDPIPSLWVCRS